MAENLCKKCESVVVPMKEAIKCGDCGGLFHPTCVGSSGEKKMGTRKGWKCEGCLVDSASTGSRASESTLVTSIMEAMAAFRKEMNQKLDQSSDQLTRVQEGLNTVATDVSVLKSQLEHLKSAADQVTKEVGELKSENARLSKEVIDLRREVEELQQHTRKNNIIVSGVPVSPRENVFVLLETLARVIDVDFRRYDISAAHRLPAPLDGRPPSIVVNFVSRQVKDEWMRAKRTRGSLSAKDLHDAFPDKPVYINEHLTPHTREIFNSARALVRDHKLASVWTSDCRVLAKKTPTSNPFRVQSLRHVRDLGGQQHAAGDDKPPTPN